MWEGWQKNTDSDKHKSYELMIQTPVKGPRSSILLMVSLVKEESHPTLWKCELISFSPSAGDYTLFEETFPDLAPAEEAIWVKAQAAADHCRQLDRY